jgi:hypothetical protein
MQSFIEGWCAFLGVTDPESIRIAVGIFAGLSLFVVAYIVMMVLGIVIAIFDRK